MKTGDVAAIITDDVGWCDRGDGLDGCEWCTTDDLKHFETLYYNIHENTRCIYNLSKIHVNIFGQDQIT